MLKLKRRVARVAERISANFIIWPKSRLHLVHERLHLSRFFAHFGVDCVFDVGANRGQYATMLRDIGFTGPIISYEPQPELAKTLRKISANDSAWHIEELALDREAGPAALHVMNASEFSSLHKPASDQPHIFDTLNKISQHVPVMRSTIAEEHPKWRERLAFKRPFLKMDTQGNDYAVVIGAGDALGSFVGLQSELAVRKIYEDAKDFFECLTLYTARGFALSALVPNNYGHFPLLVEIDCVMFNTSMDHTYNS